MTDQSEFTALRERVEEAEAKLSLAEARATEGDLACQDCDWYGPVSDSKQSEGEPEGRCDCPECGGNAEGALWWRQECLEKGAEADILRSERDAATARAERAEEALRALDSYFEFSSIPNGAEGFVVTGDAAGLAEAFAEAASILSASPPARARAEEALRNIRCVARTPEEADSPEAAFELIERLAQGALDDHSADASTIVGERERREDKK